MPKYKIKAPNGMTYQIDGPEGASQEDVQAAILEQHPEAAGESQAQASEPAQPKSAFAQAKTGAGLAARTVTEGATDLLSLPLDAITHGRNLFYQWFPQKSYTVTNADGSTRVVDPNVPVPTQSQRNQQALTSMGMPEPSNAAERVLNVAGRGATGAAGIARTAAALPGQLAQTMAASPVTQAASGATGGASAGTVREMGGGPVAQTVAGFAGGMAPTAAPYLAQKAVARTYAPKPDADTARAAAVLKSEGIKLDAAQATGSQKLKDIKASLSDNPFTAQKQVDTFNKQQEQFTTAVTKTFGEKANRATPDVMDRAANRIGSTMDGVAKRNPIKYDDKLHAVLKKVEAEVGAYESSDASPILKQLAEIRKHAGVITVADKIKSLEGSRNFAELEPLLSMSKGKILKTGAISADSYKDIKSILDRMSIGGNQQIGHIARDIRGALDDALQRSAKGADYEKLLEARQQYRAMKQVEQAIDRQGDGLISPNKLANSLPTGGAGKKQVFYGRGDQRLVRLAQAGAKVLPDKTPNSGTTKRLALQALPTAAAAAGAGIATGNVLPALGVASTYYALPKYRQFMLMNPPAQPGPYQSPASTMAAFMANRPWEQQ